MENINKSNINLLNIPFEGFEDEKRYVYATDMTTGLNRWSKRLVEIFGLSSEYMDNPLDEWLPLVHPDDKEGYLADIMPVLEGKKEYHRYDYRVRNVSGEYIPVTCKGSIVVGADGQTKVFVGTIENNGISSRIDSVSGCYNVYAFLTDCARYKLGENNDVMLIVGVDKFSDINKNYGYSFGNWIIHTFADELRTINGINGMIYRMDAVSFCIVLHNKELDDVEKVYARIKAVAKRGYDYKGGHVAFTISGGVVMTKNQNASEYSIQSSLQFALKRSRHMKHGELVIFNDVDKAQRKENLAIMEEIRKSMYTDMDGFYLCYQPVVYSASGKIAGMEALLRWNKEPFGEVGPGIFVPWIENDPGFFELGNWILKNALLDAKKILPICPDFVVNVNVSAEQIERSKFREAVGNILEEVGYPTENLCFELTERVVSLDLDFLKRELNYFRNMGIRIALDDFGTGESSLNLLLELPVDVLKIDRKFIKDICSDTAERTIVKAIDVCASGLGLDICAEGIETEDVKRFLSTYNIHKHQGYLYSKPITFEKLIEFIKDNVD